MLRVPDSFSPPGEKFLGSEHARLPLLAGTILIQCTVLGNQVSDTGPSWPSCQDIHYIPVHVSPGIGI